MGEEVAGDDGAGAAGAGVAVDEDFLVQGDEEVDVLADFVHFLVGGDSMILPVIIQISDLTPHEVFGVVAEADLIVDSVAA